MDEQGTLLSLITGEALPDEHGPRFRNLFFEAAAFTALAILLTQAWGPEAVIFSIFLTAGALAGRFAALLRENRQHIWTDTPLNSRQANLLTTVSLLALFGGVFCVYLVTAIGSDSAARSFHVVLDVARVSGHEVLTATPQVFPLLQHNLVVMLSFFVLAFLYRAYGALLSLCWNACLWGLVISFVVRAALNQDETPAWLFLMLSIIAVLPYLVVEALGYIAACLAGVFLSQGVQRYKLKDVRLRRVLAAVVVLLLLAVGSLIGAAVYESILTPRLLAGVL